MYNILIEFFYFIEKEVSTYMIIFKLKHIPNLLVRLFTADRYYVCEECHKIHRRDGSEIRLDLPIENRMANFLWYGSVCRKSFDDYQLKVRKAIRHILTHTENIE